MNKFKFLWWPEACSLLKILTHYFDFCQFCQTWFLNWMTWDTNRKSKNLILLMHQSSLGPSFSPLLSFFSWHATPFFFLPLPSFHLFLSLPLIPSNSLQRERGNDTRDPITKKSSSSRMKYTDESDFEISS